ncbi:MAG: DUF4864 domain-containing protein [Granulosicoccus sp.]
MTKARAQYVSRKKHPLILAALLIPLLAATLLSGISELRADDVYLEPNTEYQPQDVVKIVVDALQGNSVAADNDGIATVYRFASPGNRATTGPLSRFTKMITTGFSDMLNHAGARYDAMEVSGDTAVQAVWLFTDTGAEIGYAFQLGRQQSGEFRGMWMTDAVIPLGPGPGSGTRI